MSLIIYDANNLLPRRKVVRFGELFGEHVWYYLFIFRKHSFCLYFQTVLFIVHIFRQHCLLFTFSDSTVYCLHFQTALFIVYIFRQHCLLFFLHFQRALLTSGLTFTVQGWEKLSTYPSTGFRLKHRLLNIIISWSKFIKIIKLILHTYTRWP